MAALASAILCATDFTGAGLLASVNILSAFAIFKNKFGSEDVTRTSGSTMFSAAASHDNTTRPTVGDTQHENTHFNPAVHASSISALVGDCKINLSRATRFRGLGVRDTGAAAIAGAYDLGGILHTSPESF